MSCGEITFFQGRDNQQIIGLFEDGESLTTAQLTAITRVVLVIEGGTTVDSSTSPTAFDWPLGGGIGINLDKVSALASFSARQARLVIYDADHPNGLVWVDDLVMALKD